MNEKWCCRCKSMKPEWEFGKMARTKTGLRPECRSCRRDRSLALYAEQPDLKAESLAGLNQWSVDNPERRKEAMRIYRANNKERRNANLKAWIAANPERAKELRQRGEAKRKAKKLEAAAIEAVTALWDDNCHVCGHVCGAGEARIGYLVPLAAGGVSDLSNARLECLSCSPR